MLKNPNNQDIQITADGFIEYDPIGLFIVDQARIPLAGTYTLQVKLKHFVTSPEYFPQKTLFVASPCTVTPSIIEI